MRQTVSNEKYPTLFESAGNLVSGRNLVLAVLSLPENMRPRNTPAFTLQSHPPTLDSYSLSLNVNCTILDISTLLGKLLVMGTCLME